MTGQEIPLDRADTAALDIFLTSDRAPPECMMLSDLDGFLTGVAIGPELVLPSEWLPMVWGRGAPAFADIVEANAILGTIFGRYNEILRAIENGGLEPIFWRGRDGTPIAADWAEGFAQAIGLRKDSWAPLLKTKRGRDLLFPILALCSNEDGTSLLDIPANDEDAVMMEATAALPESVTAIAAYWKTTEGQREPDG